MQFKLIPRFPDGGGDMEITASTAAEVVQLIDHFRLFSSKDPAKQSELAVLKANAIVQGFYSYTAYADGREGPNVKREPRAWYISRVILDQKWLEPYVNMLRKCTGCTQPLPSMLLKHPRRLCHTHLTDWVQLIGGDAPYVEAMVYVETEPWYNMTAVEHADFRARECVCNEVGYTPSEPQYIPYGDRGLYKLNPDYGKRRPPMPGLCASWLWEPIIAYWQQHYITDAQKELLAAAARLSNRDPMALTGYPTMGPDCTIYYEHPEGHDWDAEKTQKFKTMTWEEFAKLGRT